MKKTIFSMLILITLAFTLCGCTYSAENYIFGTYYSIEIEGNNAKNKGKEIDTLFKEIDNALSTNIIESDVSKINLSKANEPIKVSQITADIFKISKEMYLVTLGAFNPASFPLTELWCFSPSTYLGIANKIPTIEQIQEVKAYCDFDLFSLDENNLTITKSHDKAMLDFGAIAKGYAADRAYKVIEDQKSFVIDVGRTFRVKGEVSLMVANPREGDFVAKATLSSNSVATSGDYERYYIVDNKRYHHIIGKDGYPSGTFDNSPIISATIIGESATICDALSTATMVLGYDSSKPILEKLGYSALLLTEDGYYTIGENLFEIKDQSLTKLN